jgi:hypothetical protein
MLTCDMRRNENMEVRVKLGQMTMAYVKIRRSGRKLVALASLGKD